MHQTTTDDIIEGFVGGLENPSGVMKNSVPQCIPLEHRLVSVMTDYKVIAILYG